MSTQIYQNLLKAFKKANLGAREKMANKQGFATASLYLAHLEQMLKPVIAEVKPAGKATGKVTGKKTGPKVSVPKEKLTIHNVHILDESGSMGGAKYTNAVNGINEQVNMLKADDTVIYTQTLVGFSGPKDEVTYNFKTPIKDVKNFKGGVRGMTALNDCIGHVLSKLLLDVKPNEKYVFTIFTDGEENASREFSSKDISKLIEKAQAQGFTVTFMGTAVDTAKVIKNLKVHKSNTLVHDNTARGVEMSFLSHTESLSKYAAKAKKGEDVSTGFFKEKGTL